MSLRVIGAGVGRTGTTSLKLALETLGVGPCYHMEAFARHPEHAPMWRDAARGKRPDWDSLFDGFQAGVDLPVYVFYKELMAHYPDAKVILTLRGAESWFESASKTIFRARSRSLRVLLSVLSLFSRRAHDINEILPVAFEVGFEKFFGGNISKENALRVFEKHNAEVQNTVPEERLLVYEVSEGWDPLCEFLDLPMPEQPFPHANTREEFGSRA